MAGFHKVEGAWVPDHCLEESTRWVEVPCGVQVLLLHVVQGLIHYNFTGKRQTCVCAIIHLGVDLFQLIPTLVWSLKQFTGRGSGSPPAGGQGEAMN